MATSNRLTVPSNTDGGHEVRSYDRDFDFVVSNDVRDRQVDASFHGQRENFANLYISEPPPDNDDNIVYSDADRHRHRRKYETSVDSAIAGSNQIKSNLFAVSLVYNNKVIAAR